MGSMTATLGLARLPAWTRTCWRSSTSHTASTCHYASVMPLGYMEGVLLFIGC